MRKTVAILAVGALVIGGAVAALAQTEGDDQAPTTETAEHKRMPLMSEVLGDLVADGTINQSQADAITAALEEKRAEVREKIEAHRELMRSLWEDGVLTAEEINQLPEDHPFRDSDGPVAEYLDDGELTKDELRELGPRPGFRRHHRPGAPGFGPFGGPVEAGS